MNGNLVTNGSFEDDGSAVPVATGWNFEGGTPSATYLEKTAMQQVVVSTLSIIRRTPMMHTLGRRFIICPMVHTL